MEQNTAPKTSQDVAPSIIIIGMAGSGKTTFIGAFSRFFHENGLKDPYIMNLDPAVLKLGYKPHLDIRESIKVKDLMVKQGLGPNGAILTALNLYAAKFGQVLTKLNADKHEKQYLMVDTPGQIEVFTWSASGSIITSAISSSYPTVLLYILDSHRCQNPNTFMSNMLFCLSIFFKTKLPLVLILNKSDIADTQLLTTWLKDYSSFVDAVKESGNYLNSLSKSMALALEEFYSTLKVVAVSSKTLDGFKNIEPLINEGIKEYHEIFLPDLLARSEKKIDEAKVKMELEKLEKDLKNVKLE